MSGHSKWHSIRHKKAKVDAQRGKLFTKVIKEIVVAARMGGGDETSNARLRTALASAKTVNMPADTVKKAIQRGTGELEGVNYEEAVYEGYGPGGVALLVECLTDNKNRTASEMRYVMSRNHGNMGAPGSVAWKFKSVGMLTLEKEAATEERLFEVFLDAGAEDVSDQGDCWQVLCAPGDLEALREAAEQAGLVYERAESMKLPDVWVRLEGAEAARAMKLIEALDDHDDVQQVYSDLDVPDDALDA